MHASWTTCVARRTFLVWLAGSAACGASASGDDTPVSASTSATGHVDTAAHDEAASDSGPVGGADDEDRGTNTGNATSDGSANPVDDGEATRGDTGPLPSGCTGVAPAPGVQTGLTLDVDGVSRSYDLFVPTAYDGSEPAPLVLNFHGLLGTPSQQSGLSQFNLVAEPRGMLVAYPAGIGNSFNAGTCCGDATAQGIDDVGFARALVDHLSTQMCIDADRVYATGMSNGGHMAHLLACEAADVFAAAASVTGVLTVPPQLCTPSRPISFLDFHGDADPIVPFGGTGVGFPAVPTMMADWAARNGCQGASAVAFEQGDMRCETWPQCQDDVEVTLCVTAGGGHCWPGAASCLFGSVSQALSASVAIATMFMEHAQ